MNHNGVNYLFDVLFHEIMEIHPLARNALDQRLAQLYTRYTPSQQQALNEVFRELFHQSYLDCFCMTAYHVTNANKIMTSHSTHDDVMPF